MNNEYIAKVINDNDRLITYISEDLDYAPHFTQDLAKYGLTMIWVDYTIPIISKPDIFKAFSVSMRWYWDCNNNYDTLQDMLYDSSDLPNRGCVLYFTTLDLLRNNDLSAFKILIEILETTGRFNTTENYKYKSLVVTKSDNLINE